MVRVPNLVAPEGAFTHSYSLRVRFGDTDAAGIVYYANYLRWFEGGRAELMRAAGLPYAEVVERLKVLMPVVETWCRYRSPARYDELLVITSWIQEIRSASLLIGTVVRRDDVLLAEGGTRMGCMSLDGKIRRLPPAVLDFGRETQS